MKNDNLKLKIASSVLLIMVGISFLLSNFVAEKREETFTKVNTEINEILTVVEPEKEIEIPEESEEEIEINNNEDNNQYETFAGILEIPKIGFSKGFYPKGSELNNVKFNLKILSSSNYPDEDKGNVIIIGHSGNYSNSYFGNLYQLGLKDTASIQYKGNKYNYKIVNIYYEDKDGILTIYRDGTKNCLTLITCTKDDETKQTVYILERYSVE